jgi:hypothetical protein
MDIRDKQKQKKGFYNPSGGEEWIKTSIIFWKNVTSAKRQKIQTQHQEPTYTISTMF